MSNELGPMTTGSLFQNLEVVNIHALNDFNAILDFIRNNTGFTVIRANVKQGKEGIIELRAKYPDSTNRSI